MSQKPAEFAIERALAAQSGGGGGTAIVPNIQMTASSLPAGSEPTVERSGSNTNPVFALGIPEGQPGQPGEPGKPGEPGAPGTPGKNGDNGATFTPSVSAAGILSWGNDGGLPNPEPVDIKGPPGTPGTNATINGEPAIELVGGENVTITQQGGTLTISATGGGTSLPPGGTNGQVLAKISDNDGDAAWVQRWSNPNLLDNWYFVDPINQRGQTEYISQLSGIYGIDRWASARGTLTLQSNGVKLLWDGTGEAPIGNNMLFGQRIERDAIPLGETITLSSLTDHGLLTLTTTATDDVDSISETVNDETLIFRKAGTLWHPQIRVGGAEPKVLYAMKLELGSVQTLAHQDADGNWVLNDPPPNKALELAKCQRYQIFGSIDGLPLTVQNNKAWAVINTPVTMRAIPTIVGNLRMNKVQGNTALQGNPVANVVGLLQNGVVVEVSPASELVYILGTFGLDANL